MSIAGWRLKIADSRSADWRLLIDGLAIVEVDWRLSSRIGDCRVATSAGSSRALEYALLRGDP
jgi:hypothetical protein